MKASNAMPGLDLKPGICNESTQQCHRGVVHFRRDVLSLEMPAIYQA